MTQLETHEILAHQLADPPRGIGVYGLWWGLVAGLGCTSVTGLWILKYRTDWVQTAKEAQVPSLSLSLSHTHTHTHTHIHTHTCVCVWDVDSQVQDRLGSKNGQRAQVLVSYAAIGLFSFHSRSLLLLHWSLLLLHRSL